MRTVVVVAAYLEDFVLYPESVERADGRLGSFCSLVLDKPVTETLSCRRVRTPAIVKLKSDRVTSRKLLSILRTKYWKDVLLCSIRMFGFMLHIWRILCLKVNSHHYYVLFVNCFTLVLSSLSSFYFCVIILCVLCLAAGISEINFLICTFKNCGGMAYFSSKLLM